MSAEFVFAVVGMVGSGLMCLVSVFIAYGVGK